MNVFVLSTGRCGSTTFTKACKHISNYTAGHESRHGKFGNDHFNYPNNHIESDNKLAWFLGTLDKKYGDSAIYIHLKRDSKEVAKSYVNRYHLTKGLIRAYIKTMIYYKSDGDIKNKKNKINLAIDMYKTINDNIDLFLKDKSKKMTFNLETAKQDFEKFWDLINAEGNMKTAIKEFDIKYNKGYIK